MSGGIFGGLPSFFLINNYYGGDVLDYDIKSFLSGNACPTPINQTPGGPGRLWWSWVVLVQEGLLAG